MRTVGTADLIFASALAVLTAGSALAQMPSMGDAATRTLHQPYDVETFGAFRNIMMAGDFAAKVRLDAAMARHPTVGVGALADARGEITIYDGKLIVSYGKADTTPDGQSESAALLAIASVVGWQSVPVEKDVPPSETEAFIAVAAKAHGIDPDASFPFEVRGGIGPYVMHVNAAPAEGRHGMGLPMAQTVQYKGDRFDGLVAGLYASLDLMGIATHGGERTHAHWVSLDMARTAHLDIWGLRSGAYLLLPKGQ